MNARLIKLRPPRIAQSFVVVATLIQLASGSSLHVYSNRPLGLLVAAAGLYTMLVAWWSFKQRQTAICPTETPSSLVTEGVFRLSRNPMYLGIVAMLTGLALIVGSLPFYVAAIVFFTVINAVFCPYEEDRLAEQFGDDYRRYRRQVRRWL